MNWKEVMNVLLVITLIVAIVGVIVFTALADQRRERICVEHGYERVDRLGRQHVCIGVRDGDTIVTPLDQVKEIP